MRIEPPPKPANLPVLPIPGEERRPDSVTPPPAARPDRLLRLPAVLDMTGRGRTSTLEDVKAGRFPQPIKAGRATLWSEAEIQIWIGERIRANREGAR
jgi:prophage regulatory protein